MKIKHIMLLSILLMAVLTLGAVSASDNNDTLTLDDGSDVLSDEADGAIDEIDKYDADYSFVIPETALAGDNEKIGIEFDSGATGNVSISIDGVEVYNEPAAPVGSMWDEEEDMEVLTGGNYVYLDELDLEFKTHSYIISFAGDSYYYGFKTDGTFDYDFMTVDFPEEFQMPSSQVEVRFPAEDASGDIVVTVDGKEMFREKADSETTFYIDLDDLTYGEHTYAVTYTGDDKYPKKTFSGKFNATFYFNVYGDTEGLLPDSSVTFEVALPSDAAGQLIAAGNGVTQKFAVGDDEDFIYVTFDHLKIGDNIFTFTYGDSKYPKRTVTRSVYVNPIFDIESEVELNSGKGIVLELPSDAKGNLIVENEVYNETSYSWDWITIATVPVVNGKASYDLSGLPLGNNYISAHYDGDDYKDVVTSIDSVNVNVVLATDIPKYIWNGTDNEITIYTPEDESRNLKVTVRSPEGEWDGDEFVYAYSNLIFNDTAKGKVTLKLPKLVADEYAIEIEDNVHSQSKTIWVKATNPDFGFDVDFPSVVVKGYDSYYLLNVPSDADASVSVYIDDKFIESEWIGDAYDSYRHSFDFSSYDVGQHTWKVVFFDDAYYNPDFKTGTFTVDWAKVDEAVQYDYVVDVNLGEGTEGFVNLAIDGKDYAMEALDEGYAYIAIGDDLSFGKHDYKLTYIDENGKVAKTKTGSFEYEYAIATNIEEDTSYVLDDSFELDIILPSDATGQVKVSYKGKSYTATLQNGTAKVTFNDLELGEEDVVITYEGDDKYPAKTVTEKLNFKYIDIVPKYDQDREHIVSVSLFIPNGEGKLVVEINGNAYKSQDLVNGKATIDLEDLEVGTYSLEAYYEGSEDIEPYYESFTILPEIDGDFELMAGENGSLTISLPSGLNGNFIAYLDGDEFYNEKVPQNGKVVVPLENLQMGEHTITFDYTGDDMSNVFKYELDWGYEYREYFVYVLPKNLTIPSQISKDKNTVDLELNDDAKGTVTVYVDDEEFKTVDVDGKDVSVSLDGLETGSHHVRVVYEDEKYGTYAASNSVFVEKPKADMSVSAPQKATDSSAFTVNLPGDAGGSVIVTINGKNYAQKVVDGKATVELPELAEGTYEATIKYTGDGSYSGFDQKVNVTAKKGYDPKVVLKQSSVLYTGKYSVTVYGADGKVAADTNVKFYIGGKFVKTVKTNAKGIAALNVPSKYVIKKYTIKAVALGKSASKKVSVKQIVTLKTVKVKKSAKKLVLTATLKKVNGKYLKGKKITFKFNGKKYTAKTNKKGVAKVTVKKSVLKKLKVGKKVKYQATYLKVTVKKTVKVKR